MQLPSPLNRRSTPTRSRPLPCFVSCRVSRNSLYWCHLMADNDQLLEQMRTVVKEEIKAEIEPINQRLGTLEKGQQELKQSQAQQKTLLEAIEAGQKDQSTKADIHRLEQKIDRVVKHSKKQEQSIANIEEQTGIASPHKN